MTSDDGAGEELEANARRAAERPAVQILGGHHPHHPAPRCAAFELGRPIVAGANVRVGP